MKLPFLYGLALAVAMGCAARPVEPRELLVAVDASGSAREDLARYLDALGRAAAAQSYGEKAQPLAVFRFDQTATELLDGPRRRSPEELVRELEQKLAASPRTGTSLARALQVLALRANEAKGPVDVLVLTDANLDDPSGSGENEMRAAANDLARNPRLRDVVVAGTNPGTRERLRELLRPLKDKLTLVEVEDAATALAEAR